MAVFRLLHLSDLHIANEPNRYSKINPNKPITSTLKSLAQFKSPLTIPSHDQNAARVLANQLFVERETYDAILISGDIATTGSEEDISAAHRYLHGTLSDARLNIEAIPPICDISQLIWMPGNHDRYEGETFKPGCKRFESSNYFGANWRKPNQFPTDLGKPNGYVHSYHLQKDNSILSIVCADFSYPETDDNLWLSQQKAFDHIGQGFVSIEVLNELERVTNASRDKFNDTAVVWAVHFPPAYPNVSESLKLVNDRQLLDLANKLQVSIIFSGHTHESREYQIPLEHINVRVLCCGSTLEFQPTKEPKLCFQVVELDFINGNQLKVTFDRKFWRADQDLFS